MELNTCGVNIKTKCVLARKAAGNLVAGYRAAAFLRQLQESKRCFGVNDGTTQHLREVDTEKQQ
jgi:hypothetical protein